MNTKVTIVVPGRWHAFDLARELEALGVLHRIITTYPRYKAKQWGINPSKIIALPLSLILERCIGSLHSETLARRLQYLFARLFGVHAVRHLGDPDLLHAWSSTAEPSLLKAKTLGIPCVLERSSSHMLEQCRILDEEYSSLGLKWPATHPRIVQQELREYELADLVAVPSQFVQQSFLAHGFPKERIVLNQFGVNLADFSPQEKSDRVFRVVFAGSLSPRKGIHYLVKAFRKARLENSELLLIGGHTKETRILVGEPSENIVLAGHKPQATLPAFYTQCSVFVMPSVEEGQACVQHQALACGLPLICTTSTGGEDILARMGSGTASPIDGVIEYPAGYVVPARCEVSICRTLQALHDDSELLARKRRAAVRLREFDLSWKRYASDALAIYRKLIEDRRRRDHTP